MLGCIPAILGMFPILDIWSMPAIWWCCGNLWFIIPCDMKPGLMFMFGPEARWGIPGLKEAMCCS